MQRMNNLIKHLLEYSKKQKFPKGFAKENFFEFAQSFFAENKINDFLNYSAEELFNSTLSSFKCFSNKKPKEFRVRVFNPEQEKDGFTSNYTFINIINDDMPFLVDSIVAYLDKQAIDIKHVMHPIYSVTRDKSGKIKQVSSSSSKKGSNQESAIQFHVDKLNTDAEIKMLEKNIGRILETVSLVVKDWKSMLNLANKSFDQIDNAKKIVKDQKEFDEIKSFISWLIEGNFVLLGAKEFDIKEVKKGEYSLEEVKNSSFGVFSSKYSDMRPEVVNSSFEEVGDSIKNPYVIEILKSRYRSKIHRSANAERIRIQKISKSGKIIGEYRFIGLFTSSAYNKSINTIPLVRNKISKVIRDSGYIEGGHSHKDLVSVLESYPRDELFQISEQDLLRISTGIVAICGRSQVRFFARRDKFDRFVSCLVFIPRERSSGELRGQIRKHLAKVYNGEIADTFFQISESNLIRLHIIVRTANEIPEIDELEVEAAISKMTRIWSDDLFESIRARFGNKELHSLFAKYKNSFSVSYKNRFDPRRAAVDIGYIEECLQKNSALFKMYKSSDLLPKGVTELKIYSPNKELTLSKIMPILESFGFKVIKEHTYPVEIVEEKRVREREKVWVHYFNVNLDKDEHEFSEKIKLNFEKTVSLIWDGMTEVGFLNRLVVAADFHWKQIYLLRAYTKYIYQTGFRFNLPFIADVLVRNHNLTRNLVELFETKFDPFLKVKNEEERQVLVDRISQKIHDGLNNIQDVIDDAAIRRFFNVISATVRTNYYQPAKVGGFKSYVSFKFDCSKIPDLPLPKPHAEIFVYSTRVEAVHLRGGKVARGGLRWSDRHEDFRTEILGLMKAQMTKNTVIVPVGSKGGFVVKKNLSGLSRDEVMQEGIECYKTFLRGLLDITDNVVNGKIIHPENVLIHDGPDPYLVVAADKGTATFSDYANSVSAEYNFWLGDAFASGGSVGYDHKKMGITAKGAWISVMRHFREMGVDTQSEDFTCVGIGDMGGDVFGNGMLLSKHIKLVAAFNHMHIFLDPNPNAAESFKERKRMFNLTRSTWKDYNSSLISKGGGVFERSAKVIKLSPEIKQVLDIEDDELTPNQLIKAILKSPIDLIWNGGIGTYVKSSIESDQDVGDRTNDALRVNGADLRCKVIGEGGNLGFTQKGRIEYALNGGRINTDAIDNSAGVDCSDHEVNIKIALTAAMRNKKITLAQRNKMLESMTEEVSELVLHDNNLQTQAISVAASLGYLALGDQSQFIDKLEKSGLLNREIEFLPSKKEIEKRQVERIGLSRPELSVLLSYSKMDIYNQVLDSDLVNDKFFESDLVSYFPKAMRKKFLNEILKHQLRKEIIATQITNFVVNRVGITFVNQICQDSGFKVADVVKSLIIACNSFRLPEVWDEIEELDGKVDSETQIKMFLSSAKLIERSIMWLLRNKSKGTIVSNVDRFSKIADDLFAFLPKVLAQDSKESFDRKVEKYRSKDVNNKLAIRVASMDPIASTFDIAEISASSSFDLKTIAKIYFEVGTRFSLKWLRSRVSRLDPENYWQKVSNKTILEDLYSYQMRIAKDIVDFSCKNSCEINSIESWIQNSEFLVNRFDKFISGLKSQPNPDISVFVVALNRLKPLAH